MSVVMNRIVWLNSLIRKFYDTRVFKAQQQTADAAGSCYNFFDYLEEGTTPGVTVISLKG